MEPARVELAKAINETRIAAPVCRLQKRNALPVTIRPDSREFGRATHRAVRWTQSVRNMVSDGATRFLEVGPGKVLQGLVKKISAEAEAESAVLQ